MMTAMHFRHELSYDATPDEVFEMLADPAFRERVSTAQEVVSADVAIDRTGEGFSLTNDQVQRTAGLPSFAKKFTGETTRAIQVEDWPDRHGGSLRIDAPGKPSSITGTIALLPDGDGTTEVVELDVKVKVPLIGGKLEGLLADTIRKGIEIEQEVGRAWLSGA
jgi:uncharacterized protein YndB with AHSA1/START domain